METVSVTATPEPDLAKKLLYNSVASILTRHISEPKGRYVDWKDVDIPAVENEFKKRSPRETKDVIRLLTWHVIHYEYLR